MRMAVWTALALAVSLTGCVSVYRMDVQQGNVLTAERLDQLKTGMSRSQVRFVLGTPLVTDPFHPNRWDYVYFFRKGRSETAEIRRVTLYFKNDTLTEIAKADVPADDTPKPVASP